MAATARNKTIARPPPQNYSRKAPTAGPAVVATTTTGTEEKARTCRVSEKRTTCLEGKALFNVFPTTTLEFYCQGGWETELPESFYGSRSRGGNNNNNNPFGNNYYDSGGGGGGGYSPAGGYGGGGGGGGYPQSQYGILREVRKHTLIVFLFIKKINFLSSWVVVMLPVPMRSWSTCCRERRTSRLGFFWPGLLIPTSQRRRGGSASLTSGTRMAPREFSAKLCGIWCIKMCFLRYSWVVDTSECKRNVFSRPPGSVLGPAISAIKFRFSSVKLGNF